MVGAMAGAALLGQAIRSTGARTVAREAAVGAVSLAPALFALRGGDLAAYHGVEHKSIAAYEQDGEAAEADKEHDRCGSNLVAPMIGAAAVGNVAARRAGLRGPLAEAGVAIGSAAVAVEVFAYAERHDGSRLSSCCVVPAMRSSAWWARGSPATSSSRWAAPRWRRSCAWREPPHSLRRCARGWTRPSSACRSSGSGRATTPTPTSTSRRSCSRRRAGTRGSRCRCSRRASRCSAGSTRRSRC